MLARKWLNANVSCCNYWANKCVALSCCLKYDPYKVHHLFIVLVNQFPMFVWLASWNIALQILSFPPWVWCQRKMAAMWIQSVVLCCLSASSCLMLFRAPAQSTSTALFVSTLNYNSTIYKVPHPGYQRLRGRKENMLGVHLNPNKRRLTLAPSVHVYTNERTTDRVSGDPLVWVCPMKPLTLLRGSRVEC